VLGICRGMQIVNVALGGTLRQDVRNADGATPHRRRLGGFEGTDHRVALRPGSLAAQAAGELRHRVHCHHHQALLALGDGLEISGRAEDDVPEAVEATDGGWLLGVQWHPEAVLDGPVLRAFADACREHAARTRSTNHHAAAVA
jgi:putative glutamine amidotransferase